MVQIKAIFRKERLEDVVNAVHTLPGMPGAIVWRVQGYSRRRSSTAVAGKGSHEPMVKIEVVVPQELGVEVVNTIRRVAGTRRAAIE